ncbi:MAG TPA: hypothetical protein VK611_26380 [Acidimicrobiales bacterium]|nr:hypothetical protein [Acidimicrobiales bacterium]
MAAPEYVPQPAVQRVRSYESPPRRAGSWMGNRPGEVAPGRQPQGPRLGMPGPDQGYAYVLAHRFEGRLYLTDGEHEVDAIAGCVGVALKRASVFGRAPVLHDLTVAFTVWGFLREAPEDLVALRKPLFAEVANPYHYAAQRRIVDMVAEDVLRQSPQQVAEAHLKDWRALLDL